MRETSPRPTWLAFASMTLVAFVLLSASCVPHRAVSGGDVTPPEQTDILQEDTISVAAAAGASFSLRGATLTVPPGSLEFDALVRFALCKPSAAPATEALPEGVQVLACLYAATDVRVAGDWPLEFLLMSDFGDPNPYDPGFRVWRFDPRGGAYVELTNARVSETTASFGILPGYTILTVPIATPRAIGLTGSANRLEILFPSMVLPEVGNAFGIRDTGTDLQRFTNALAAGYVDRPYGSRDGRRLALVRERLDRSEPDRVYATTPSNPLLHLTRLATAAPGGRIGDLAFEPSGNSVLAAGHVAGSGQIGSGVFRIYVVGDDRPRLLYRDPGPTLPRSVACSPDGATMAVTTSRYFPNAPLGANYDIVLAPVDGGPEPQGLTRLTEALHSPTTPLASVEAVCFSVDGGAIYFGARVDGESRIYRVGVDGSNLAEIESLRGARWPAISPDGSVLACERSNQLVLHNLASGSETFIGPPANGFGYGLIAPHTTKLSWLGR